MKKVLIASLFVMGFFGAALAGDYHMGSTLVCSDCHVMHFAQHHGYNADGTGIYTPLGTTPQPDLLRDEVNRLCLNCHDGAAFAPDVAEANFTNTYTRQAGALNRTTDVGTYNPPDGHTLYSTASAPGGTWSGGTPGLKCVNCHQQHGYPGFGFPDSLSGHGMYRNLVNNPGTDSVTNDWVTYAIGANDLTKDVFERSGTLGQITTHYAVSNVDFNEPDPTKSAYGAWCKGCHTNFHGSSSDAGMRDQSEPAGEGWLRHPTADANIGAVGGGHSDLATFRTNLYRTQVMSPTGVWGTQGSAWPAAPANLTPSCFSCHKGHGNQNAFGLIFAKGDAALGEQGDGTQAKDLCQQCHVQ